MPFLAKFFKPDETKILAGLTGLAKLINEHETTLRDLTDTALKNKTAEFKKRLQAGAKLDDLTVEAFAVVRETARRTLGERHYDVQLLGGLVLHRGQIAEMKTGEGKTLVATLPVYLNALAETGVHVVTVNDYLARRDAVWMGQIYSFLGLTVGVINNQASYLYDPSHQEVDQARDAEGAFRVFHQFLKPCDRRQAYQADVTYGTNNEFGFDYLRDHLAAEPSQVVQRGHPYAIIDEVDSILIDEARTPLIISAPITESPALYQTFARLARSLTPGEDYEVDLKHKAAILTEAGIDKAEKILGTGLYTEAGVRLVHHLETAVRAEALFHRDEHYVIKDGEVIIVDEFTGRLQPGRRWSEGLHQAIEAKEGVRIQAESRTHATITLQNYFRLYRKIAGMTGTALTSSEEFLKVYGLPVVPIPPNQPSIRIDHPDLVFQTEKGKLQALTRAVKTLQEKGQPVLVGTVSIEKNELISSYFRQAGIVHKVLNAKNHEEEGAIIAGAGRRGSVVIATNLAGRGVDIKLGGPTATVEEREEVKKLGGLFVLGTERHEARRIDNQLRGRAARQGDPGETQFYLSLEDSLLRAFAPERVKGLMNKLGLPEDEPIAHHLVSKAIESAQAKIEGLNFDARKHLLEYDDVTNHQRQTVYRWRESILFGGQAEVEDFIAHCRPAPELTALIEKKKEELGEVFTAVAKRLILQVIDTHWVEHLDALEHMRGSVRLRAYGQRDPLVEFKREGLRLYKEMERSIFAQTLDLLAHLEVKKDSPASAVPTAWPSGEAVGAKIGRNDPCPCGSGKKYKKCGLLNTPEHQKRQKLATQQSLGGSTAKSSSE